MCSKKQYENKKHPYKHKSMLVWEPGCINCGERRSTRWYIYDWNQVGELQAFGISVMLGKFKNGVAVSVPRSCNACNACFSALGIARRRPGGHILESGDEPDTVYVVHDPAEQNDAIELRLTGREHIGDENTMPGRWFALFML